MKLGDAAKQLKVSRATLSRVLNDKSSLSIELATRLESAFGANAKSLLEMQNSAVTEKNTGKDDSNTTAIAAYSPPMFQIRSTEIDAWAGSTIAARTRLPVLLRRLINSTTSGIKRIDFPGNDEGERRGNDGIVVSESFSAWVPSGESYWEFGTNSNPYSKAEKDYKARRPLASNDITFIFVTPRRWPDKKKWEEAKNRTGEWKEVRAYDANDLEQWLEASPSAQSWMAEQLNLPHKGVQTLDDYWDRWAKATEPQMNRGVFALSVSIKEDEFSKWLDQPPTQPLVVSADSKDEALAFISCLFDSHSQEKDKTLVVTDGDSANSLLKGPKPPILVANSSEAELVIAPHHNRTHCLLVRPRGDISARVNISLDLLSHNDFCTGLKSMGYSYDDAYRLASETGRSPAVLRRRLAKEGAVLPQAWSLEPNHARLLIGPTLLGVWNTRSEADCRIVSALVKNSSDQYDLVTQELRALESKGESPIWRASDHVGLVSKIDTLFSIAKYITESDLDQFFSAAKVVLSEKDPSLDLPEKDRWAAALYNKSRNHSSALRKSIGDTLVILSVDGEALFGTRLDLDVQARVESLIRDLLIPMSEESILSQLGDLQLFAEAAPDTFLKTIENDLKNDSPIIHCLLKPASDSTFGHTSRTQLLWALELLSWRHLHRTCLVLANLSQTPINDNVTNKPIESLVSIFRYWMPQTAASEEDRLKALVNLFRRYPTIALEICFSIVSSSNSISIGRNSKPLRRGDATGYGEPITAVTKKVSKYRLEALNLILNYDNHTTASIVSLIETVSESDIATNLQERYWATVFEWARINESDKEKAVVRHAIRQIYGCLDSDDSLPDASENAKRVFSQLKPSSAITRHGWLFNFNWINWTTYELKFQERCLSKDRDMEIRAIRCEAAIDMWSENGLNSIMTMANECHTLNNLGRAVGDAGVVSDTQKFILDVLKDEVLPTNLGWRIIEGYLSTFASEDRQRFIEHTFTEIEDEDIVEILLEMHFNSDTWKILSLQNQYIHNNYWKRVPVRFGVINSANASFAVRSLLSAKRPKAAFEAASNNWDKLDTDELTGLLEAVAHDDSESEPTYTKYDVENVFSSLTKRPDVNMSRLTQLEFAFLPILADSGYSLPNVHKAIYDDPNLFVQLIMIQYKRKDEMDDGKEIDMVSAETRHRYVRTSYTFVENFLLVPKDGSGNIEFYKLLDWIKTARTQFTKCDRLEVGDEKIGQLLAKEIDDGNNGVPEAVANVIDEIASEDMARGFWAGALNLRGFYMKSDKGGDKEHALADKFEKYAENIAYSYPLTARTLQKVAQSYKRDALREDDERNIRFRDY